MDMWINGVELDHNGKITADIRRHLKDVLEDFYTVGGHESNDQGHSFVVTKNVAHAVVRVVSDMDQVKGASYFRNYEMRFKKIHAEREAIQNLENPEETLGQLFYDGEAVTVDIYLSYSPCNECSQHMIAFSTAHPYIKLNVIFAALYNVNRPSCIRKNCYHFSRHRVSTEDHAASVAALRRLRDPANNITLRAFGKEDWRFLETVLPCEAASDPRRKQDSLVGENLDELTGTASRSGKPSSEDQQSSSGTCLSASSSCLQSTPQAPEPQLSASLGADRHALGAGAPVPSASAISSISALIKHSLSLGDETTLKFLKLYEEQFDPDYLKWKQLAGKVLQPVQTSNSSLQSSRQLQQSSPASSAPTCSTASSNSVQSTPQASTSHVMSQPTGADKRILAAETPVLSSAAVMSSRLEFTKLIFSLGEETTVEFLKRYEEQDDPNYVEWKQLADRVMQPVQLSEIMASTSTTGAEYRQKEDEERQKAERKRKPENKGGDAMLKKKKVK